MGSYRVGHNWSDLAVAYHGSLCQPSLSWFSLRALLSTSVLHIRVYVPESQFQEESKVIGRKAMTNLDSILKSKDITLPTKVHIVKAMVFPVVMYGYWELDHKEGWVPKNWWFQTVILEKTPESPLDSKEIQPANPKGNQSWIFTGRTDAEAKAPILWLPDVKSQLNRKDPGKDWRQEEKGMTEDEMVG